MRFYPIMVNDPGWDGLPDVVEKRAYQPVLTKTKNAGKVAALRMSNG